MTDEDQARQANALLIWLFGRRERVWEAVVEGGKIELKSLTKTVSSP
jgi:hypothetical protein